MKRTAWAFLLLISLLMVTSDLRAGSIFSATGQGEPVFIADARLRGMGGTGLALTEGLSGSLLNPSLLGGLKVTAVTFTARPEALYVKDEDDNNVLTSVRFQNFALCLPLGKKLALGLDYRQRSDFKFKAYEEASTYGEPYTRSVIQTGGLNQASVSLARSFGNTLYAGVRIGYVFGRMTQAWKGDFGDIYYQDTKISSYMDNTGTQLSGGLALKLGGTLSVGASYEAALDLEQKETRYSSFSPTRSFERTLGYPPTYGLGLSYRPSPKFLSQLDIIFTQWSAFEIDGEKASGYADVLRLAAGFEYRTLKEKSASFFRRVPLRFGYALEPWYLKTAGGDRIYGHFLTLGVGLPFGHQGAHLDASLELGLRGNISTAGAEEKIVRGTLSIWGYEPWFQRKK